MKTIALNGNDIIIAETVTKQDYSQNRIKYETRFSMKEMHNKIFLINKEDKSKILFTTYLFNIKEFLGLKEGVVIIANYQAQKDIYLLGTLENPLDSNSLLKLEFLKDKFYENNILSFSNWIKFFTNTNRNTYVITDNVNEFKETIDKMDNLEEYKFIYIPQGDIEKINADFKCCLYKEDLISIYAPSIIFVILMYFTIGMFTDNIIQSDIKNSHLEKQQKSQELSSLTQKIQTLKNSDYFKNRDYYMQLSERKIYTRASND